jgi:hypothetical protein
MAAQQGKLGTSSPGRGTGTSSNGAETDWHSVFDAQAEACREVLDANPVVSVLAMFGVGLGIGVCIGAALAGPPEPPTRSARMLESLRHMTPDTLREAFRH